MSLQCAFFFCYIRFNMFLLLGIINNPNYCLHKASVIYLSQNSLNVKQILYQLDMKDNSYEIGRNFQRRYSHSLATKTNLNNSEIFYLFIYLFEKFFNPQNQDLNLNIIFHLSVLMLYFIAKFKCSSQLGHKRTPRFFQSELQIETLKDTF